MVGIASISLFSLDVEGAELKVLLTHDWSIRVSAAALKVVQRTPQSVSHFVSCACDAAVRVWCIEVGDERRDAVDALLSSKGYEHTRWHATGKFSFEGSELWVRRDAWKPQEYAWRQYQPNGVERR